VGGGLQVASFNVLNYFDTLDLGPDICGPDEDQECRGADSEFELERQRAKIVAALAGLDADIVGLIEIENDDGEAAADILAALNAVVGAGTYAALETGTIGTDAIKVAMIYKPAVVTPIGDEAILDSTVDPRFDDTRSRPALAQTFQTGDGGRFTLVVNHLKSKGSECAGDPDIGDGQGNCNVTRTLAAEALVDWLASDPTSSGDRDVLVIGDLNAYAYEDPIDVFIEAGYQDLARAFEGDSAYSYVFQGQSGYLDHALASPTLAAQVTGATDWHINADEPPVLDYNVEFKSPGHLDTLYAPTPYRSSDHDPVLVGLDLLHFGFEGYLRPLAASGTSEAKAGSALPVRFRLTETTGLGVLFTNPVSWQVDCDTAEVLGSSSATSTTVGLTQDGSGSYTYDWKSLKSWARTCRVIELTFDDGAYRRATIHFVK
jgi:predicted extracellular nuclease